MNIYDADGLLDRGKVLDELDEILVMSRGEDLQAMRGRLVNLLDECCEGFTVDPFDAPTMVAEHINSCRPAWSETPPLDVTTGKRVPR